MNFLLYYAVVGLIACVDQIIKWMVVHGLVMYEKIPIFGGLITVTHIRNSGAAYNLFSDMPLLLIFFPGIVMTLGLIYIGVKSKTSNKLLMLSFSMVIGGGLGNLIDRISKGYVVDYLDIKIIPVFNVADMCICIGCGLLFIYLLFMDGKHHEKS